MKQTNLRKWTLEDEHTVVKYIKVYPHNLHKAFLLISEELADKGRPRSVKAIQAHWYNKISKQSSICFFTASMKSVSKNRKNGVGVETNISIWRKLLNIIKGI